LTLIYERNIKIDCKLLIKIIKNLYIYDVKKYVIKFKFLDIDQILKNLL